MTRTPAAPLIHVDNLVRHYALRAGGLFRPPSRVRAVNDVSFTINDSETFALVGESGCGKSTVGRLVLGLDRPTGGTVRYRGAPVHGLDAKAWRALRCELQMIFQDPLGALNPRIRIGAQLREPLDIHGHGVPEERVHAAAEAADAVGLPRDVLERYPHELSGGQQQRIAIARALVLRPRLIVCDEPVSALDVSLQAQVVMLLQALQRRFGIAYLFISHDLALVRHIADRVAVMYLGAIMELADADALFDRPLHPYSRALISAVPVPDPTVRRERILLAGDPPSALAIPDGCPFHTRCPVARDICRHERPELRTVTAGRQAACHFAEEALEAIPQRAEALS